MPKRVGRQASLAAVAILALTSCQTVNYDDQADQQLTSLSQEINLQLIKWKSQVSEQPSVPAAYDKSFYDKVEADLTTLEIRMEASQSPSTEHLVSVFSSLTDQFEGLRKLHSTEQSIKDPQFLQAELDLFDVQIAALETYELSLKPSASGAAKTASTATTKTASKANGSGASSKVSAGPVGGS